MFLIQFIEAVLILRVFIAAVILADKYTINRISMSLVICMSGNNTRFHNVGFDLPKYLLPWAGSTIIHSILSELRTSEEVVLIANKRDYYFKPKLLGSIEPLGLTERNVHYINDTLGQAHTAAIAAELVMSKTDPFLIHNADTIVYNRITANIRTALQNCDAYIDTFIANSPAYCYVQLNDKKVSAIVEKKAISPFASSGLYAFKNANVYLEKFNQLSADFNGPEMYISNLLSYMLNTGSVIITNEIDSTHSTTVLGTPQEYGLELTRLQFSKQ
jgi:dTDP-glucose pyrophosphorylase